MGIFLGAPLAVRLRGCIVGGFNPFEKYARQIGFIFPRDRGEHLKIFDIFELPPPRYTSDTCSSPASNLWQFVQCRRHALPPAEVKAG